MIQHRIAAFAFNRTLDVLEIVGRGARKTFSVARAVDRDFRDFSKDYDALRASQDAMADLTLDLVFGRPDLTDLDSRTEVYRPDDESRTVAWRYEA